MLHVRPRGVATALPADEAPVPRAVATAERHRIACYPGTALAALAWPAAADDTTLDGFVYQSREFLAAWRDTLGAARRADLFLLIVDGPEGEPVLWLPLVVEREFGCRVLRFPDGGMADYNAPILARGSGVPASLIGPLWAAMLRTLPPVDAIDFAKMPASVWDQPNPLLGIGAAVPEDEGYYLPIAGAYADYLADPSRKPRVRKIGQLRRKLERRGTLRLGEVRDAEEVATARAFLERHKTLQYRRTLGFSQFDEPGVRAFVDRLCTPGTLATLTRLTALSLDGAVIGAQLDFVTPRRQQGFVTTFDAERYGFASPGRQVLLHLIARAFADGREVFDLGHGDNPFKHPWMTAVLQLYGLGAARSWRGAMFLAARGMRRRLGGEAGRRVRRLLRPRRSGAGTQPVDKGGGADA